MLKTFYILICIYFDEKNLFLRCPQRFYLATISLLKRAIQDRQSHWNAPDNLHHRPLFGKRQSLHCSNLSIAQFSVHRFRRNCEYTMQCGSPVSNIFRLKIYCNQFLCVSNLTFKEPISKIAPKMTSGDDLKRSKVPQHGQIALVCPAQSYPVGAFR